MDENQERLRAAAQVGDIGELYETIKRNVRILEEMDEAPFIETPLHTAAAAGKIKFAMEMMNLKPSFARKLNPSGFSPMHLALQNKQTQVVLWLIKVDKDLVSVKGREGITPLHMVVEQGDVDLLAGFLKSCPECIKDVTSGGETALHVAVSKNKLEALKVLVGWLQRFCSRDASDMEREVLNCRDIEGNTVLHNAAATHNNNQHETIKLLSGCRKVNKNVKNLEGLKPLDIFQRGNGRNEETENILQGGNDNPNSLALLLKSRISSLDKLKIWLVRGRMRLPNGQVNAMLVVSALIITAAYQGVLSPPGGISQGNDPTTSNTTIVWQAGTNNATTTTPLIICNVTATNNDNMSSSLLDHKHSRDPGKVVTKNKIFLIFNTVALAISSMLTMYLLPQNSILSSMFRLTLLLLFVCYFYSMELTTPTIPASLLYISYTLGMVVMELSAFFFRSRKMEQTWIYRRSFLM